MPKSTRNTRKRSGGGRTTRSMKSKTCKTLMTLITRSILKTRSGFRTRMNLSPEMSTISPDAPEPEHDWAMTIMSIQDTGIEVIRSNQNGPLKYCEATKEKSS
eukprot:2436887-Rhodomonas_salina.2